LKSTSDIESAAPICLALAIANVGETAMLARQIASIQVKSPLKSNYINQFC